jgi:Ethanolamine utilization protein EutJ (predicted chaperonin)
MGNHGVHTCPAFLRTEGEMKFLEGHTVGIDLGTTYSAIAMLDNDGNPMVIPNADNQQYV